MAHLEIQRKVCHRLISVDVRVTGIVQGVGFRYFTYTKAREYQVFGWVRNEKDGSVRVRLEGNKESVSAMIACLRQGPPHACVDYVRTRLVGVENFSSFEFSYQL